MTDLRITFDMYDFSRVVEILNNSDINDFTVKIVADCIIFCKIDKTKYPALEEAFHDYVENKEILYDVYLNLDNILDSTLISRH